MHARTVALLTGTGLVVCIAAWLLLRPCRLEPDKLKRPLEVVGARAMPDGGTLEVRLVDAGGKEVVFKRSGSLAVDVSQQDLRVISYLWLLPLSCDAPKGSQMEAVVKDALQAWLSTRLTPDQQTRLARNDQDALKSIPYEVIASYDLASWLDRRR